MIKNNRLIPRVIIIVSALIIGCDDVFEQDIRDEIIEQVFPPEGQVFNVGEIPFQWSDSEDADFFRLQIAQVNNLFITDTLINAISFVETLEEGSYKWRVRAENSAYESKYSNFSSFSVEMSSDLEQVSLVLNTPLDNSFINSRSVLFSWSEIANADSYIFNLFEIVGDLENNIFSTDDLTELEIQITENELIRDGVYRWSIKAVNQESETNDFSRIINVDTESPPLPMLITPSEDEEFQMSETVGLTWSFLDAGVLQTSITSKIEISLQEDFLVIIDEGDMLTETSYNFTPSDQGTYYWRVVGEDVAGNIGEANASGRFIVN